MSRYSHFEMCEKIFGQKYKWDEQKRDYEPYSRTDMWNKMIEQQDKISDLEAKLAEKDKELSEYVKIVDDLHKQLSDKCDFCDKTKGQDKISFAVEQLEKLKVKLHIIHTNGYLKAIDEEIDDRIKELKGEE